MNQNKGKDEEENVRKQEGGVRGKGERIGSRGEEREGHNMR